MSKRYNWALAILTGTALVCPAIAARQGGSRAQKTPIEGRWDITVTEGKNQGPSWVSIKQQDGQLVGQFLGGAGSVGDAKEIKFENGTVSFKGGDREWTGKLEGDKIEGTFKSGDAKWVAHRFISNIDVSGKWDLKVGDKTVTLNLKQRGDAVTGKWVEDGKETEITKPRVMRQTLVFQAGEGKTYVFEVKGDSLQSKGKTGDITGKRERKWGKPVNLFDGKESDLANWQPLYSKDFHWKVADGVMTNGGNGTENVVTKRKDFHNFKLHVEFKVPEHGNSGVYLRGRYEIQVEDTFGKPANLHGCGSIYSRIAPKVNACKKAGEWQTFDIVLIDNYLTVVQNDQTIIDNQEVEGITGGAIDSNEAQPGPIYLQGDHTQVWYRKMVLTPAE